MRPLKLLYLLLFTTTWLVSRHVTSHELIDDLDKNESQIEVPPIFLPGDLNILENVADKANDAIIENVAPETEETQSDVLEVLLIPATEDSNNSETAHENQKLPVFSEWTQQQIQEAEKKLVELTNSTEPNKEINETLAKHQIVKMRQKNYASPDCGAKILASNPEAQSTSSVLTDKDEYLLSPCTDRIWFVVELCDSIQAQRVELANFELFSSPLKSISISVSNRFPTRDWTFAGQFDAKSERDVQVFDLSSTLFGKFARVDLTYTNTEHYCPLSFFRVFGTSEIEAFEVENEPTIELNHIADDDELEQQAKDKVQPNKDNLLNRAGEAVVSFFHKAKEVLAKGNGNGSKLNETSSKAFRVDCMSLSHNILCQQCSSDERVELDNFISCKNLALSNLLGSSNDVRNHLVNSETCHSVLGFNLKSSDFGTSKSFLMSILPPKYIAAMCNLVASDQKFLELRSEDIPAINSNLISKKDEVSLKNISKKVAPVEESLCKQDSYPTTTVAPLVAPVLDLPTITKPTTESVETVEPSDEQNNASLSGDELNIFNVVDQQKQQEASPTDSGQPAVEAEVKEELKVEPEVEVKPEVVVDPPASIPLEPSEVIEAPTEPKAEVKLIPEVKASQPEVKASQPEVKASQPEVKVPQPDVKPPQQEMKSEYAEIKINGGSSNPPESVFLRLSNRIKTLEKNMTLSTQYLEELSRRYKKQIEDIQQSFAKLQSTFEDQSSKKRESDKRDGDERRRLRENLVELNQKTKFMEVILIILTAFFTFLLVLVIALFKRMSILRNSFAAHQLRLELKEAPLPSPTLAGRSTARKRSKQRCRKISAPNILTQRSPTKNEFTQHSPVLNRTCSAPNKFSVMPPTENKENFDDMQAMLEENDDILIPGFQDLKLNDDDSMQSNDTASTASAVSHNEKPEKSSSNRSFKFKRRLSSPFKSSLKKSSSDQTNQKWLKKAQSESPPPRPSENLIEFHKSKSFHDDDGSVKFKKSNSFKKLFKKIF